MSKQASHFVLLLLLSVLVAAIMPSAFARSCGVKGSLGHPYRISDDFKTSYATCAKFCASRNGPSAYENLECRVFSYSPETHICSMYFNSLKYMGFKADPKSKTEFTDARCLTVPKECDKNPKGNMVDNGGFEFRNDSIGPWLTQRGNPKVVHPGFKSANALLCIGDCFVDTYRGNICKNTLYEMTFKYKYVRNRKGGFPGVGPTINVFFSQNTWHINVDPTVVKEGEWHTARVSGILDDLNPTWPGIRYDSRNNVWNTYFDNFNIVPLPSRTPTGPNLLKNGGFETIKSGEAEPWIAVPFFENIGKISFSSPALSQGSKKLEYSGVLETVPPGYGKAAGFILSQYSLPTEYGKTYEFSFDYVSADLPVNRTTRSGIVFGNGVWTNDLLPIQTPEQAAATKHFRRQVMATSNNSHVDIGFTAYVSDSSVNRQHTIVDNVQIREVI